jgi:hypothetical protein
VAIVVSLIKVVALGTFKGCKRRWHSDDVFTGTAVWTGGNDDGNWIIRMIHLALLGKEVRVSDDSKVA